MADMKPPLTIVDTHATATAWIRTSPHPFTAAFIGGSSATAPPESPYDPASDIDCYLVVDGPVPPGKIGKILVDGVLLDVSWLPWQQIATAEANAVFASLLNFGRIMVDRDGRLTAVQQQIQRTFTDPAAIEIRLEDMRQRIRGGLAGDSSSLPNPEQVMNWLFPATLATHLPLIAACVPLTVRKRFLVAKRVMTPMAYEELLGLYGFADITREQTQQWLDLTAHIFAENTALAETSVRFWAGDIREDARTIAIGGSQHLIDTGLHREALYWIIATYSRCLVVRADADLPPSQYQTEYEEMLTTLGIRTTQQRAAKSDRILEWIEIQPPSGRLTRDSR